MLKFLRNVGKFLFLWTCFNSSPVICIDLAKVETMLNLLCNTRNQRVQNKRKHANALDP